MINYNAGAVVCFSLFCLSSEAVLADRGERLDVASAYSTQNMFGQSAERVASQLKKISGGKAGISIYDPGELVPAFEIFPSVSSGAIPAGWTSIAYLAGTLPIANLYGALPFSPPAEAVFSWTFAGGGLELLQKSLDPYNVKVLPCSFLPQEPGGWFNKEISNIKDLDGLSMRISGLGAKVLNAHGVSTQLIPGNEVYLSLERGRVDAAEFSIPEVDSAMGLPDIAKNYYFPGWQQGAGWLALLINKGVWNSYDESRKAQFEAVCRSNIQEEFNKVIPAQVKTLERLEKNGTLINRFPENVLAELQMTWEEVLQEERERSPDFSEAYKSLIEHAALMDKWYELQALPAPKAIQGESQPTPVQAEGDA
ncbi:TRAP transporter substrate-binding protein [Halomonas sp. McH1-25]|nr:TRAP transporter substrate-binding protein [Halomonas sp. McH1-25]